METHTDLKIPYLESEKYLLNGKLVHWDGPMADVKSNIYLTESDNLLSPTLIGKVPDMDEASSIAALEASVTAFNRGKRIMANNDGERKNRLHGKVCFSYEKTARCHC